VKKTVGTSVTYFVYDEKGKLIGEYNAAGSPIQEIVYLTDIPVASLRGADIFYIYADHLGTPRQIVDAANQLRWGWDSDPFGTTPADENPSGLGTFSFNLRFPGSTSMPRRGCITTWRGTTTHRSGGTSRAIRSAWAEA
jgi:uncharacterized protein RhaS with RHS repeats